MAKEAVSTFRHSQKATSPGLSFLASLIKGWVAAVAVTVLGVILAALIIQWLNPSDAVISIINQALKLCSIAVGVRAAVNPGEHGGTLKGAAVGLGYMGLGMLAYALLSSIQPQASTYLADLGMGVAAGGLCGMFLSSMKKR